MYGSSSSSTRIVPQWRSKRSHLLGRERMDGLEPQHRRLVRPEAVAPGNLEPLVQVQVDRRRTRRCRARPVCRAAAGSAPPRRSAAPAFSSRAIRSRCCVMQIAAPALVNLLDVADQHRAPAPATPAGCRPHRRRRTNCSWRSPAGQRPASRTSPRGRRRSVSAGRSRPGTPARAWAGRT